MSLKNPVIPPGIDPGTFRQVAQRLNHYATPGPFLYHVPYTKHVSSFVVFVVVFVVVVVVVVVDVVVVVVVVVVD